MQFSESWLRQYVNPDMTTEQLSHALTMAGLEVEETRPLAPPFTQVVVAEILEAAQHPDADRLRVCKVNAGGETLQIVCGAPNARVGIKIPCALVGAQLPPSEEGGKPFAIKLGKLRGVESQGMLCSGRELGVGQDSEGIMELAADAPNGQDIREHLKLDDTIFIIKLTPNKADCLSILGVAREVSAESTTTVALRIWSEPTSMLRPFPESAWALVAASKPVAQPLSRSTAALTKAATAMFLRAMKLVPFRSNAYSKICYP